MACSSCGRGFFDECECSDKSASGIVTITVSTEEPKERRRPDDEVSVSAGRKRAAVDYPIMKNMPCEWRNMANCGGGKFPIIGCTTGLQVHRHHGPVKKTTRNEEGNVHRICPTCHNTWHAKNDPIYSEEEFETLPHDPRPATLEELLVGNPKANKRGRKNRDGSGADSSVAEIQQLGTSGEMDKSEGGGEDNLAHGSHDGPVSEYEAS